MLPKHSVYEALPPAFASVPCRINIIAPKKQIKTIFSDYNGFRGCIPFDNFGCQLNLIFANSYDFSRNFITELKREIKQLWTSFIFTLHLAEKWQRHPAADLRGCKPFLQFTIFSSNKSVNYFYLKMKDARLWYFI